MKPEQLQEALDLISRGVTRPTQIAKALGVSYRAYCQWMVRSNSGDEKFLIEGPGAEIMQFAKAVSLSTKLALFELRGMILQESIFGWDEQQVFQGSIVWTPCPIASAMEPDEREALGFRRDGLLVKDGKLVPLSVKRKAPFAQQIALLRAAFPDLRESTTVTQNVNVAGSVGVAYARPVDYSKPPVIPPLPPVPELPPPIDGEFNEMTEEDFEDLLGPEPEPIAIKVSIEPMVMVSEDYSAPPEDVQPSRDNPPPVTERVIRDAPSDREKIAAPTPAPIGVAEVPLRAPRNALEADLFAKLAEARAKGLTS